MRVKIASRQSDLARIQAYSVGEALKPRVSACGIDKVPRKNERPSDHAPVVVTLGPL